MVLERLSYRIHEFPLLGKKINIFVYCNSNDTNKVF